MSTILSTTKKTFRFINEFDENPSYYCDTTFTVKKKRYNSGGDFYYITCENKYSENNKLSAHDGRFASPFYDDMKNGESNIEKCYTGVLILISNPMSDIMVEYLLMDFSKLSEVSGHVSAMNYKISIIKSLTHFWD